MSGVYIPMEMPTGCDTCPFEHFGDCYGAKAKRIMDIDEEVALGVRHTDCPLVPVPDHGELIDRGFADVLSWRDGEHGTTFDDGVMFVLDKLDDAPTIIPADPADKEAER